MRFAAVLCAALAVAAGCASPPPPYDYGPYLTHMPRSILVIPPLNESTDPNAPYSFLSTISAPIAERGYYVFPVAVVAELLKQNGCPTPGEMHAVPPEKLREVFGADAVLYVTVKKWTTEYRVIDSATTVSVTARLVDLRTGDEFWSSSATMQTSSSQGQNDAIAMLITAVISQIASNVGDPPHALAPALCGSLVYNAHHGMLLGPYHPGYAADQNARRFGGPAPEAPAAPPVR